MAPAIGEAFSSLGGDDLAQAVEEIGGGFSVHPEQIRRRSGGHAGDEIFSQTILLFFR